MRTRDIGAVGWTDRPKRMRGRNVVAVIGINRYQNRLPLTNAVRDALGTAAALKQLGFVEVTPPLLDEQATEQAIRSLVIDDLKQLRADDSLLLFYAGHGISLRHEIEGGHIETGYLVPVDANERVATWIDLSAWVNAVARLRPRHILVVLDACHSGIALGRGIRITRGDEPDLTPLSRLYERRSRRIITSAMSDERAADGGPIPGHSLFTGYLIDTLQRGVPSGETLITGLDLAQHLHRLVRAHPESRQIPACGTFDLHHDGEMLIPVAAGGTPDTAGMAITKKLVIPVPREHERRRWRAPAFAAVMMGALAITWQVHRDPAATEAPHPLPATVALVAKATLATDRATPTAPAAVTRAPSAQPRGNTPSEPSRGCPAGMAYIRAGGFEIGTPLSEEGERHERPSFAVAMDAYCIDRTEVTVGDYHRCVDEATCRPLVQTDCNRHDALDRPVNCVTWLEARTYCRRQSRYDLPTEAQWEYAASGPSNRRYPWGNQSVAALPTGAAEAVGKTPIDQSSFGVRDLAGNVSEWTYNYFAEYDPDASRNPRGPRNGALRVVRGGNWESSTAHNTRTGFRGRSPPGHRSPTIGFRCAYKLPKQ